MNKKLLMFFVVLFIGNIFCFAQNEKVNSKPTGLALEINFHKERKPAYMSVPENEKASGSWFSYFQRVPNWQPAAGSLPVKAVNFVVKNENDAVKINVSVFNGQKFDEKEEFVVALTMRENEKVIIKDLLKFGVVPIEISLIRITRSATTLPSIDNKCTSLTVIGLEPNYSTIPSYKLKLANNSEKTVSAFFFYVTSNDKMTLSGMPQGIEGKPLIESGGSFEKVIQNSYQNVNVNEGQTLLVQLNQKITISAVVFEDGTFEGSEPDAANFLAFNLGRKLQIKRILDLLQQSDEKEFDLAKINKEAENLSNSIDEIEFNKFISKFSNLNEKETSQLRIPVEVAAQAVKTTFLKEIGLLAKSNFEPKQRREMILANIERYRKWLAQLDLNFKVEL